MDNKRKPRPVGKAFFGFAGTVIAPIFRIIRITPQTVPGFTNQAEWQRFCEQNPENAYEFGILVKPVIDYAETLKANRWEVNILTVSTTNAEENAKRAAFYNKHLNNLFNDIIFVRDNEGKVRYIQDCMHKYNLSPRCISFVDDNLTTLSAASELGIHAAHTSHISAGLFGVDGAISQNPEKLRKAGTYDG